MMGASLRDRASRAAHRAAARLGHPATIACAYALIGVGTFGHAASEFYRSAQPEYQRCQANPKCVPLTVPAEPSVYVGLLAGMLWPLYWSWELQQ
jgi:hypothetical protein